MKSFLFIYATMSCLPLYAMEKTLTEAEQIALIAEEIFNDYQQHIQEQESAFRAACMQRLFLLNKKKLVRNSPYYNFEKRLKTIEKRKDQLAAELLPGRAESIENEFLFYCITHSRAFVPRIHYALQSWKKNQN